MLNRITIMGRLVKDPELRRTGTGVAVCSFRIACEDDFAPKDGEKKSVFVDCTAWRNTGEFIAKYFTKGRMIVVDGSLDQQNWTDKDGNKRSSLFIKVETAYFGDSKKEDGQQSGGYAQNGYSSYGQPAPAGYGQPPYAGNSYAAPAGNNYATPVQQPAQPAQQPVQQPAPTSYAPQGGFAGGMPGFQGAPMPAQQDFSAYDMEDEAQLPF